MNAIDRQIRPLNGMVFVISCVLYKEIVSNPRGLHEVDPQWVSLKVHLFDRAFRISAGALGDHL